MIQENKTDWTLAANMAGIACLLALVGWNTLTVPMGREEGEIACAAVSWLSGGVPYKDVFLPMPPIPVYAFIVGRMFPNAAFWGPRVLSLLALAGSAWLLFIAGRALWGRRAGWFAAWFLPALAALPTLKPYAFGPERFMLLPLCGMLAVYAVRKEGDVRNLFWAGLLGGLAAMSRFMAVDVVLALLVFWTCRRSVRRWSTVGYAFAGLAVGIFLPLLPVLVRGGFHPFMQMAEYLLPPATKNLASGLFISHAKLLAKVWMLPLALFIPLVVWGGREIFAWLAIGLLVCSFALRHATDLQSFALLLPFVALVAAGGLSLFLDWLVKALKEGEEPLPLHSALAAGAVLVSLLLPIRVQFMMSPIKLIHVFCHGNPFLEAPLVAERMKMLTKESDTVLLAGSEPELLYLAGRRSVTRFVSVFPLTAPSKFAEGFQKEVLAEIAARPPRAIVLAASNRSWQETEQSPRLLHQAVADMIAGGDYEVVGGYVWEPGKGYWAEPLPDAKKAQASLILFNRIRP